jgi:8-amino-7-oxononanoate synthase
MTPCSLERRLLAQLDDLDRQGLRRQLRVFGQRRPGRIVLGDRELVNFSGNDYLGLSHHPVCIEAAARAARDQGTGAGASRVVSGGSDPASSLEKAVIHWMGTPAVLVFPSGYQANLGVVSALAGPGDLIFSDARNHASLIDGCRLPGATVRVYPHRDVTALEQLMEQEPPGSGERFVVTDTLFSMSGALAPMECLSALCERFPATLIADEAHAVGVIGPAGTGVVAARGAKACLRVGTFSKALGSLGAFVATTPVIADWLVQRARSFVYTTFLPPAVLAASQAAVELVQGPEGDRLRGRVLGLATRLRDRLAASGLRAGGVGTPIVSLSLDSATAATGISGSLVDHGLLVWAFRPPTVPADTSLIRIGMSAAHREDEVEALAEALIAVIPPGSDPGGPTGGGSSHD